jgi:hypothetical protein
MYASMSERSRYKEVLLAAGAVVLGTYVIIMASGYYFFAQYTLSPSKCIVIFHSVWVLTLSGLLIPR